MELVLVDKSNYNEAIKIQKSIFPLEDGTLNILNSLDRELFMRTTGLYYLDDGIKYYLAIKDGKYVGITGLYYYDIEKDSAWIAWFGITDEYRNKGMGRELLEKTMGLALSKGFKYIRLYTDYVDNYDAIKLYEKCGFTGEKYTLENLPYDCRIYSKSLIGDKVIPWNNKMLSLEHQSELDQMDDNRIIEIHKKYDDMFKNK